MSTDRNSNSRTGGRNEKRADSKWQGAGRHAEGKDSGRGYDRKFRGGEEGRTNEKKSDGRGGQWSGEKKSDGRGGRRSDAKKQDGRGGQWSDGKKSGGRSQWQDAMKKDGREQWSEEKKLAYRSMKAEADKNDEYNKKPDSSKEKRSQRFDAKKDDERGKGKQSRSSRCPAFTKCGGCQLLDMPYEKQLELKKKKLEELLKPFCKVNSIIGMEEPLHYRNKVHAVFDHDKKGNPVSGVYEASSHRVVPVESCLIEDEKADEIIGTIRGMLKSFKIRTFDEDTGYGLLRHVLIRRGFTTGEIMVVLVTSSPIFPSKNNFVKALREKHPEITTIIQNVNGRDTSMVLGDKEQVLFGKGYIEDILCGYRFRISSKSFYQVNPKQTEILYKKAMEAAGLTGNEKIIDAYCGIGTIGIVASGKAREVIGVELNRDAVADAIENAKLNGIKNAQFFCNDAGRFMVNMAENGEHVDVVFMDPPRTGSTEEFIRSVAKMKPEKVVYISCNPETLARDLEWFGKMRYEAKGAWGIDLFPLTNHCECIVKLCHK